jgi:hypothetical protein
MESRHRNRGWRQTAGFPIIADDGLAVSKAFDMLPAEAYLPEGRTPADSQTVRSVFIIGPDKKLKLTMTYPMNVGRNFAECCARSTGFRRRPRENVATPADWVPGQDVVVPVAVSDRGRDRKIRLEVDTKLPIFGWPGLPGLTRLELPAFPSRKSRLFRSGSAPGRMQDRAGSQRHVL